MHDGIRGHQLHHPLPARAAGFERVRRGAGGIAEVDHDRSALSRAGVHRGGERRTFRAEAEPITRVFDVRAGIWSGSAAAWQELPAPAAGSWGILVANEIWSEATSLYVIGSAYNNTAQRSEALLWTRPLPPSCSADFDGDGFLTGLDFDAFVAEYEAGDSASDFDSDGFVTGLDFDAYVQAFEEGC